MSLEAANALLKTLEEPPEYAVIILVSDESMLLETIISRCQLIRFSFLADQDIEEYLLDRGYSGDEAAKAAKFGQGSISTALRYLEEEDFGAIWQTAVEIVRGLAGGDYLEIFESARKMEREPVLLSNIIEIVLRDICIYQETNREELLSIPDSIELASTIKKVEPRRLMKALGKISNISSYYRRNVNPLLINTGIAFEVWEALK
jgi:DNA polymerase-3 subunit delta'